MSHAPVSPDFPEIFRQFAVRGELASAGPFGNGHINETYVAVAAEGGRGRRYVLQKVNHHIFKNVPALMENVRRVTEHVRAKVRAAKGEQAAGETLRLVPAVSGAAFVQSATGEFWRCYDFIEGAHTVDRVTNEAQAREAARAFGEFQAQLADLPGGRLHETIPHFHHTRSRFEALRVAIAEDRAGRAKDVAAEIEFALAREADADVLLALLAKGEMAERVTHNDTKINNVMLGDTTGQAVAVIDLDTIMPGLPLYDFGEMVRTSASSTWEDDPEAGNMHVRLPLFRALVEGYLGSEVGAVLNATERAHLGFAGKLMTYENGLRFLTDFLQGDTYYKIKHPRHNLVRTRTQFALVRSIERESEAMAAIVREVGGG
ncbi:aminoglycoside phosphotransferase family protein [Horticoccus luteus]|uniref:Aminoglycoside phosphotransferase family protein n=1 Tax=Horticoccus luteus TaxID=2862869 RepID=A0A8F9TTU5_9BACT|nr:aminoglycoside phosphotransferase family protein [Horticoccus luteus]QYM79154.1 aminoglycoside phosphotransferase family protein [Horticoccus luteus]